jgi:hypothetical protein
MAKETSVAAFPALSWAPQVTIVVPTGKKEPGGGSHQTPTGPSMSSVAEGSR